MDTATMDSGGSATVMMMEEQDDDAAAAMSTTPAVGVTVTMEGATPVPMDEATGMTVTLDESEGSGRIKRELSGSSSPDDQRRVRLRSEETSQEDGTYLYWNLQTKTGHVYFQLPTRYDHVRAIGRGSYGCVARARDQITHKIVAVKKIECVEERYNRANYNKIQAKMTYREVKILAEMQRQWHTDCDEYRTRCPSFDPQGTRQHDNISELLDCYFYMRRPGCFDIYMVFEYAGEDLGAWLRDWRTSNTILSCEHCVWISYKILRGLLYLHSAGIVHRDLKPQNIAMSKDLEVKILDFGLARLPGDTDRIGGPSFSTSIPMVVTQWYRAPEVIMREMDVHIEWTQAIDMWAFGCIFCELFDQVEGEVFKGEINSNLAQLGVILTALGWPDENAIRESHGAATASDMFEVIRLTAPRASQYRRSVSEHPRFRMKFRPDDEASQRAIDLGLELMDSLVCFDPHLRLTAEQAINHPYFQVMFEAGSYWDENDHPVAAQKFDDSFETESKPATEWYRMVREEIDAFTVELISTELFEETVDELVPDLVAEAEAELDADEEATAAAAAALDGELA